MYGKLLSSENIQTLYNHECNKIQKARIADFVLTHCEARQAGGYGRAVFEPVVLS